MCAASQTEAEIGCVIAARDQAIMDEAQELFGASTPEDARRGLVERGRACLAQGYQDGLTYLVLDFELQKRSRYYAFEAWADTPAGRYYLHKWDWRTRQWIPMPRRSEAGRFVVPRDAKGAFKTHCDHTFGEQEDEGKGRGKGGGKGRKGKGKR